jgi:signal transduction histidine kinase
VAGDKVEGRVRDFRHDLRNPLAALNALVAALPLSAERGETGLLESLDAIADEAAHVVRLCRQAAGLLGPGDEAPVHDVVRGVVLGARAAYSGHIRLEGAPAIAAMDADGLRRCVWNLVGNACRAAGPDGTVRIRIRHGEGTVIVAVDDDGPGFGPDGPPATGGTGLAIVRRELAACGGRLLIGEAEDFGGACVAIEVPAKVVDLDSRSAVRT